MNEELYDPFGSAIHFSNNLEQQIHLHDLDIDVDIASVITHPAMMFETTDGTCERFYLRTIEWDNNVLIRAKKEGDIFIADQCQVNPPGEQILEILKKCRQAK